MKFFIYIPIMSNPNDIVQSFGDHSKTESLVKKKEKVLQLEI